MDKDNIVTVHISPAPAYKFRHAILCDRDCPSVIQYARAHPNIFVLVFSTKSVAECFDYSGLYTPEVLEKLGDWITKPVYVGNFIDPAEAIQQYINVGVPPDMERECILDESLTRKEHPHA